MIALIGKYSEAEKFAKFYNLKKGDFKAVGTYRDLVGYKFESYIETVYYQEQMSSEEYTDVILYLKAHKVKRNTDYER